MNNNHTDITIVLDRSGSMIPVAGDTIGGFNRFLEDQKKSPGAATLSLHQFDHEYNTVIDAKPIAEAQPLTHTTYVPRGTTALLDAIGRAIVSTGKRLESTPERDRAGKVIFTIITDGFENCSREYTRPQIFDMINHQRDKYAWQFVFLGANQDAIQAGMGLGVSGANSMTYAHNHAGVLNSFGSLSANTIRFRSASKPNMSFEEKDYKMQADAGAKNNPTKNP